MRSLFCTHGFVCVFIYYIQTDLYKLNKTNEYRIRQININILYDIMLVCKTYTKLQIKQASYNVYTISYTKYYDISEILQSIFTRDLINIKNIIQF
jgi:hypothetical protein